MQPKARITISYVLACFINKASYLNILSKADSLACNMSCQFNASVMYVNNIDDGNNYTVLVINNDGHIRHTVSNTSVSFKVKGTSFTGSIIDSEETFSGEVTGKHVRLFDSGESKNIFYSLDSDDIGLVNLQEQYELLLSELYEQYSYAFVEQYEMWQELAQQEQQHAKWARKIREGIIADKIVIENSKAIISCYETANTNLKTLITDVKSGYTSPYKAIETTKEIIKSNVEQKSFNIYGACSKKAIDILFSIQNMHHKHITNNESYMSKMDKIN